MTLSFITANLWRENPRPVETVRSVLKHGAHIIGVNEGRLYGDVLLDLGPGHGYRVYGVKDGNKGNNPILIHEDLHVVDFEQRIISEEVGDSPQRTANCVKWTERGKRAHINTHMDSHVQEGYANPHELPRVDEYIEGMREVTAWGARLSRQGWAVTVTGDMNWSFGRKKIAEWYWSPQRAFRRRAGMVCQFKHFDPPTNRDIEYVFWHPKDYSYLRTETIKREWSDHPIYEVTLRSKP